MAGKQQGNEEGQASKSSSSTNDVTMTEASKEESPSANKTTPMDVDSTTTDDKKVNDDNGTTTTGSLSEKKSNSKGKDSSSKEKTISADSNDNAAAATATSSTGAKPVTTTTKSIRNQIIFPTILYDLLKDVEKNDEESIISWTPTGRGVQINKPDEFVTTIFPRYFRHQGGMKQFQRQLKDWGFKRIDDSKNPEDGSYYHELFIRGKPELCRKMRRNTLTPTSQHHHPSTPSGGLPTMTLATIQELRTLLPGLLPRLVEIRGYRLTTGAAGAPGSSTETGVVVTNAEKVKEEEAKLAAAATGSSGGTSPDDEDDDAKSTDDDAKDEGTKTNKKKLPMTDVSKPLETDIMNGRGGITNHHPGNQRYRRVVSLLKHFYTTCSSGEKGRISQAIVASIRDQNGRFLESNPGKGTWFDIGDDKAIEKTSQCLREFRTNTSAKKGKNKAVAASTVDAVASVASTAATGTATIPVGATANPLGGVGGLNPLQQQQPPSIQALHQRELHLQQQFLRQQQQQQQHALLRGMAARQYGAMHLATAAQLHAAAGGPRHPFMGMGLPGGPAGGLGGAYAYSLFPHGNPALVSDLGGVPQQPGGFIGSSVEAAEDSQQAAGDDSPTTKKIKNKKRLTKQSITELEKLQPGLVPKLVQIIGADRLSYYVFPEDLRASSNDASPPDEKPTLSLKNIVKPRDTDVLCGGTNKQYDIHPGNSKFKQVIHILRGIYQNARGKDEKMKISGAIVDSIRGNQGRFVEKSTQSSEDSTKVSNWVDIGDKKATKMVYDAFRNEGSGMSISETPTTSMPTISTAAMQANVGVSPAPEHSHIPAHLVGAHHLMLPGMGRAFGVGGPAALGMNYLAGAAMHLPHMRRAVGGIPPMIPPANPAGNGMYKTPFNHPGTSLPTASAKVEGTKGRKNANDNSTQHENDGMPGLSLATIQAIRQLQPGLLAKLVLIYGDALETHLQKSDLDPVDSAVKNEELPKSDITEPMDSDILCGRGGGTNHHLGNIKYRRIVNSLKNLYSRSSRNQKGKICHAIVNSIRESNGRFIGRKGGKEEGPWYDIGNEKAIEKTSQCLREKMQTGTIFGGGK